MSEEYRKGDLFIWRHSVAVEIIRVAKDGTWADVRCSDYNGQWTKRQRLPLDDSFRRDGRAS